MIRTGMIVFFYSILSCLCIKAAFAEDKVEFDKLAGDLPKLIDADGSPYLVTADIFVPSGKSVTIEAGTVFLFKNFTGIHVQGILEIKGTKSAPVILTSENEKMFNPLGELNPTPYDWNGIYIHKDAIGSELVNFIIQYSVKGIVSETRFLKIENGIFKDNGRSNLTIEDEEKTVTDAPYSYSLSIKDATVDGIPVKILTDPDAPKRQWIRYSGLALFIGGGALGGIFVPEFNTSNEKFKYYSSIDQENLIENNTATWKSARDLRNRNIAVMTAGFLLSAVGLGGFGFSFTF